jgi:hypothetical protein
VSFQLQFQFLKYEEVTGCQIRGVRWVGDKSNFVFRQKLVVRAEVWDGALSWWSSQVCSRQSWGQYLPTFSRIRRKTS